MMSVKIMNDIEKKKNGCSLCCNTGISVSAENSRFNTNEEVFFLILLNMGFCGGGCYKFILIQNLIRS